MQECQAGLVGTRNSGIQAFLDCGSCPGGAPSSLQSRGCWSRVEPFVFSGGLKQLPLVFYLVTQSPEFLIVGVPFLGRGHPLWKDPQVSCFR